MTRRRFRFRRPSARIESMEHRVLFAAGDIDLTFGGHDGVVVQDVVPYVNADFSRNDYKHGEGEESLHDAAELPDGRLLAVGGGDGAFVVCRYNPDGSPDATFGGGDGIVQTVLDTGTLKTSARAVTLLADGKFLVAGTAGGDRFALARYNADGSLDTTFATGGGDGDGVVTSDFGPRLDVATAIAVLPSGKILLGGTVNDDTDPNEPGRQRNSDFGLARYNADGTPDATFGPGGDDGDGLVTHEVRGGYHSLNDLLALPDGRFFAAGSSQDGSGLSQATIVRYRIDGSLDTTFGGGDGVATAADAGAADSNAESLSLLPDGTIVLAGSASHTVDEGLGGSFTTWFFSLARLGPDGTPDTSFGGGDGVAISRIPGPIAAATPLPGGKFLAAVQQGSGDLGTTNQMTQSIRRYDADGSPDEGFGTVGETGGEVGAGAVTSGTVGMKAVHVTTALRPLADGRVLVVGAADTIDELIIGRGPGDHLALARLTADGAPDTSFGADGTAHAPPPAHVASPVLPSPRERGEGETMLVLPDGSVLVSGTYRLFAGDQFILAKYRPDGTLDPAFSPGGADGDGVFMTAAYVGAALGTAGGLALAPDGKIVAYALSNDGKDYLLRFGPDGTPDATFGAGGAAAIEAPALVRLSQLAVDEQGRVLAAAGVDTTVANSSDFAVFRFNADGTPDPTFGTAGVARAQFLNEWQAATALQLLPGGKILAGGSAVWATGGGFALARFNPDGSLDPTFGAGGAEGDGRVLTPFGNAGASVTDLALMPDGRFVAAGSRYADIQLARYHVDGSLDTTFGPGGDDGDGRVSTNLYTDAFGKPSGDAVGGVVALPDGSLLVAGTSSPFTEPPGGFPVVRVPFVARYEADGTIDKTFGHAGSGVINFNVSNDNTPGAYDIALQPGTNRVLIGGAGDDMPVVALDPATATGVPPAPPGTPAATVIPPTVTGGSHEFTFSVQYSADAGIDVATIDGNDVRVTGPGGFSAAAQLVSVFPAANAPSVLATYRVAAPNGVFSDADNGTYTIAAEPDQVRDTAGVAVAAGPLAYGSFTIAIAAEGPNLAVGRVTFAGRRLVDGRRHRGVASFVLRNTGAERFEGPLTVSLLASTDRTAGAAVATLATATLQISLRPGAARRYTVRLGAPGDSLPAGLFYATVDARPAQTVELDLTDNAAFTARPFRVKAPRPGRPRP